MEISEDLEENFENFEENETKQVEKKKRKRVKRYCSVPQCGNRNIGTMHRVPKDAELRKLWSDACRFTKLITNYTVVCNNHFLPSDFIPRWDRKLKRLKSIAVPSQCLPVNPFAKKLERATKRLKKEDPRIEDSMAVKEKVQNSEPGLIFIENSYSHVDDEQDSEINNGKTKNMIQHLNIVDNSKFAITIKTEKKKLIEDNPESSSTKSTVDYSYSNIVCKCNKNESKALNSTDSPEIRSARILVELNEKVFEMIKANEINFAVKDIALKVGEEFYLAARRYYKTTIKSFLKNDYQLHFYTGIDAQLLKDLEKAVIVCEENHATNHELTVSERIILCFMKLRLNFTFSSLGSLFYLNEQVCKKVFYSTIQTLKVILRSTIYWPTKDEIMKRMPESLDDLKKTTTVLDRTEIEIENAVCSKCNLPYILINENSRHLKILLGFSKSGWITYVSTAMHGRTSNETITNEAYISKVLVPSRDAIMTDGFFIEEACNRIFIESIKKRKEKPYCPEAALKVQSKTVTETLIENAFRRFNLFRMFRSSIPFDMVPYVDDISVVVCGIVNLNNSSYCNNKV